jgi:protein-S-isoprenylcysteine O-methyltransferase Ste14
VAPLPYTNSGAQIAFYLVFGIFILLEFRVRVRSRLNEQGTRTERGSLLAVYASVYAGMAGGFALAGKLHAAAIADWRWPMFVVGLVLMGGGIAVRQWAIAVLGQFFTVDVRVHPGRPLLTKAPTDGCATLRTQG